MVVPYGVLAVWRLGERNYHHWAMRTLVRQILARSHLLGFATELRRDIRRAIRKYRGVDSSIISDYFSTQDVKKLHIGCGQHLLPGWLNTDVLPASDDVLHLDASKPFPFENDVFAYIFSEHMIEHIPYSSGLFMLSECHRVLRGDGRIRVSTPDLQFLIDLYRDSKSESQVEYIRWATDHFVEPAPYPDDTFVINNFVRAWGHSFIYDEKTLRWALERAGFADVVRCELNESGDNVLRDLENEDRMPEGLLKLETLTMEGRKLPPPT